MAREDFFGKRHRAALSGDRRNLHLALQARDVERKQAAIFDDLPRDLIFAARELFERNLFTVFNARDQIEVGRGQQAEVLAVLTVDALDVFGDNAANACGDFGIRRLLAA